MHGDAERLGGGDYRVGDVDVGLGGRGVAGWMIMDQDQGRGRQLQRPAHDFTRVDGSMVHGAVIAEFVQDQLVLAVRVVFILRTRDMRGCGTESRPISEV